MSRFLKTLQVLLIIMCSLYTGFAQNNHLLESATYDSILCLADVTIINTIEPYVLKHQTIQIKDDVIISIANTSDISIPKNSKVINLKGKYLIPGLIDGHVHLTGRPERSLEIALKKGVVALRDMGGDASYLKLVKDAVISNDLDGPDIYYSALLGGKELIENDLRVKLSTPPNYQLGEAPWMRLVSDSSNVNQIILDARNCGATGIKMYSNISPELCRNLVSAAKKETLKTWGHAALFPASVEEVIAARTEVISHVPFLLYDRDWDLKKDGSLAFNNSQLKSPRFLKILELMRENKTSLDPTLSVFMWSIDKFSADEKSEELKKTLFAAVKLAFDYGIKIVAGTDVPLPVSEDEFLPLHKEIEMFVKNCGLPEIEALKTATIYNAEILGIDKTHGSVEVGKKADLVILTGNPLKRISNIEKIYFVVKNGKIINTKQ
jgi:imidazolonepropionase-like amidohydrolase